MLKILIPIKPITKKNSIQMAFSKAQNRWFPVPSKAYKKYEAEAKKFMPKLDKPINKPLTVKCLYYLHPNKDGSIPKNQPDLTNLVEATDDILVKFKVIEDDNISIIKSHDGSRAVYDISRPESTEICIYDYEE